MPKALNLIVACSENRTIARHGRQPWRIPEDMAFFHAQTAGNIVVLGRVTFQAWPQATQDGRSLIVVTRQTELARPNVRVASSFPDALAIADREPGEIYICGGERIYVEALTQDRPMRLYLTLIHAEIEGDRHFPEWRHLRWREVSRRESENPEFRYTFLTLER